MFREEGLDDLNTSVHIIREGEKALLPGMGIEDSRNRKRESEQEVAGEKNANGKRSASKPVGGGLFSKLGKATGPGPGATPRPAMPVSTTAPPPAFSTLPRAALIILLVAMVVPGFRYGSDSDKIMMAGADADIIRSAEMVENGSLIEGRQTSPTAVCTRWAHQGISKKSAGCVFPRLHNVQLQM